VKRILGASVLALAALGCGTASDAGVEAGDAPEGDTLFWLNPARCLVPCTYLPSRVRINDEGVIDAAGRHEFVAHAQPALQALLETARNEGHPIFADSAFRTYELQVQLFSKPPRSDALRDLDTASTRSARPWTSGTKPTAMHNGSRYGRANSALR